ncbi:MAG: carboxypeptidase-like regulatory domain-containing protein [Candidatus Sulfotelmatobacter sp.]
MRHSHFMQVAIVGILLATPALMLGQAGQVAELHEGTIAGTVTDVNHDTVPGAMVFLEDPNASDRQGVVSNDDGYFEFHNVKPGIPYQVSISAKGFADWHSPALVLEPRQFKILADIELRIEAERTTINVTYDPVQEATQQVKIEEQQKVLGFIPNYYVVYDRDPVPLTAKLKFDLALKTSVNPVTIAGVALYSGMQQAGDTPNYGQGMKGYSKRFGANAAGGISDILIGGAILPSLLHQDPRYLYQGIGTTGSRIRHAMFHPFVCRGDNGVWQPNYSSMGGDLASSALAYTWFPNQIAESGWCSPTLRSIRVNEWSPASRKSSSYADSPIVAE